MKSIEILNRFNNEGIFPTDDQLQIILDERNDDEDTILSLELELFYKANKDVNHPYHLSTQPIPVEEMTLSDKKLLEVLFS